MAAGLRDLPDFPAALRNLLLHMILSHHGELEFGSPKVPVFAEVMLLHHLDNLDSKMECIRGLVERDRLIEGVWTSYSAPLDRSLQNAGPAVKANNEVGAKSAFQPASSPSASKLQNALRRDGSP